VRATSTTKNPVIGCFSNLGAPNRPVWGSGLSGAPLDHWLEADMAASRCAAGTTDCPVPRMDRPVHYNRRRLKTPRAASWTDSAPDYPVGGTKPSGALQCSTFHLFLSLISFALFWTYLYDVPGT
jgi:hypothetical protein